MDDSNNSISGKKAKSDNRYVNKQPITTQWPDIEDGRPDVHPEVIHAKPGETW